MTYTYTDRHADRLEIATSIIKHGDVFIIGKAQITSSDAPRIALEILKAAGHPPLETGGFHTAGTNGHLGAIAQELQDAIEINEKLEEAERRDERREELAAELTIAAYGEDASVPSFDLSSGPVKAAIDRIIELENKN